MLKQDPEGKNGALLPDPTLKSGSELPTVLLPPPPSPATNSQPSPGPASAAPTLASGPTTNVGGTQGINAAPKPKSTTDPAPTALRIPVDPAADSVKYAMSNINKSLKAKQRVINSKEPLPKNASKISEFINKSPVNPSFPPPKEAEPAGERPMGSGPPTAPGTPMEQPKNPKRKPKKSSTKTDFFAAKLASAVDDVDSSDSDETFVYENNPSEVEPAQEPPNHAPAVAHINSVQSSPTTHDPSASPSMAPAHLPAHLPASIPPLPPGASSRAQSIHSILSRAPKQPKPQASQPTPGAASVSSTNYFDQSKRPPHQRTVSGYSNYNQTGFANQPPTIDDRAQHPGQYTSTNSIDQASLYSFDAVDVDADLIDDDDSTEGEFFSNPNMDSSHTTVQPPKNEAQRVLQQNNATNTSLASKNTSKKNCKSSVSSSKLRSTTSKLFNKKGSQPRRYSIIPDDVDIEDFDDDLIYYDGSIRFPYANTHTNSYGVNESSSLLNAPRGKIPHYRSLNLYPSTQKRASDKRINKRYLSTGQPLAPPANEKNRDMFPFAYPDHQNYYYEYDDLEDGGSDPERVIGSHNGHSPLLLQKNNRRASHRMSIDSLRANRVYFWRSLFYTLLSIIGILGIGFIMGFVLASTKDLTNVQLSHISDTLVSKDELVFNIEVTAFNPGWFTVEINEVELDVFAKSGYLQPEYFPQLSELSAVETVLLGTVYKLDPPMIFSGGIFTRDPVEQSGEIRLLTPGKNITGSMSSDNSTEPDNLKKWEVISKNPFDLIVRGTLKYNLPFSSDTRSVVVNKVGYVDPTQNSVDK